MINHLILFATGFIQVVFVAINTWQIAHKKYWGIFPVGFMISFVWSFNVKRIAFGDTTDRLAYALGAGFGTLAGVFIAKLIYRKKDELPKTSR